jgi:hypothetical protein
MFWFIMLCNNIQTKPHIIASEHCLLSVQSTNNQSHPMFSTHGQSYVPSQYALSVGDKQ